MEAKFPGSPRVRRLNGMELEAKGELLEASKIYKAILEEDETNVVRNIGIKTEMDRRRKQEDRENDGSRIRNTRSLCWAMKLEREKNVFH